jgi:hypothetical protein
MTLLILSALATSSGTASAGHVSATMTVTAALGERVGNSWIVEVQWSIVCNGASDPDYFGNLNLDDQGSGESIYLGGISSGSGTSTSPVSMESIPRTLTPRLNASCAGEDFHGSGTQEVFGNEVVVPALNCDPDLLAQALREFDTARAFSDAAVQDLKRARDEYVEARDAWVKQALLIGAAGKGTQTALSQAELGRKALTVSAKAVIVARIFKAIEAIGLKLIPTIRETRRVFRSAQEDMERFEDWSERADASLEAALAQGPCVGSLEAELDRALDEQRRQDEELALIERWENNGYLYLNPATGELHDQASALREARRSLAAVGGEVQSNRSLARKSSASDIRRLRAAVAKLKLARTLNERVRDRVRNADAAAERLRDRLGP